ERVRDEPLAAAAVATLHLEATELVERLRCQPDVAHHRDAGGHQPVYELGMYGAALELDRVAAAFLDEPAAVCPALIDRRPVRHERHVAADVRALGAANDGAAVVGHLLESDRECGVMSLHDHAERIADQEHVGSAFVE